MNGYLFPSVVAQMDRLRRLGEVDDTTEVGSAGADPSQLRVHAAEISLCLMSQLLRRLACT